MRNASRHVPRKGQGGVLTVYWSTYSTRFDTAKENDDCTVVTGERQVGTQEQTWTNREMPMTFYTTEDTWSEKVEDFTVSYTTPGHIYGWTTCGIDIIDDDGPGVWRTWTPMALRSRSQTAAAEDPSLLRPIAKGSTRPTMEDQTTPSTEWGAFVDELTIESTRASGDTYVAGETMELKATFDREVSV